MIVTRISNKLAPIRVVLRVYVVDGILVNDITANVSEPAHSSPNRWSSLNGTVGVWDNLPGAWSPLPLMGITLDGLHSRVSVSGRGMKSAVDVI